MTLEEYQKEKEERKGMWLARVLAHGTENRDQVIKEALEKFESSYPKYETPNTI